jgi:hypothetical protein
VDGLKELTCRACGKVSAYVSKDGRLQMPGQCPYCGTGDPYPNPGLKMIAIAGVLLVLGMLTMSLLR